MDHPFDRDWSAAALLRFALPTAAMMVFMGVYTVTDTVLAARLVNTDALSAINIVCPVVNVTVGLGTMLSAGGNALLSRRLGEGREREAGEALSLLVLAGAAAGLLLALLCGLFLDELTAALGAEGVLAPYCRDYLGTLLPFLPANMLQTLFAALLVTAGRPSLGFGLSGLAGLGNIALDYLLMGPLDLGIRGAAEVGIERGSFFCKQSAAAGGTGHWPVPPAVLWFYPGCGAAGSVQRIAVLRALHGLHRLHNLRGLLGHLRGYRGGLDRLLRLVLRQLHAEDADVDGAHQEKEHPEGGAQELIDPLDGVAGKGGRLIDLGVEVGAELGGAQMEGAAAGGGGAAVEHGVLIGHHEVDPDDHGEDPHHEAGLQPKLLFVLYLVFHTSLFLSLSRIEAKRRTAPHIGYRQG